MCLMGSTLIFFYSFRSDGTFDQMFLYYLHFISFSYWHIIGNLPASLIHLKSFAHVYSVCYFYVIAKNVYDVYSNNRDLPSLAKLLHIFYFRRIHTTFDCNTPKILRTILLNPAFFLSEKVF